MPIVDNWDLIRTGLAIAIVICNFFVWRGVSLEESADKLERETGKVWLVNALAWEFFFAMVLVVVDTVASVKQKQEIAILYNRAVNLDRELVKLKNPRIIRNEDKRALVVSLHKYAGSEFWIIVEKGEKDVATEQQALGTQLEGIFVAAGWHKNNHWSRFDEKKIDPEFSSVSDRGCQITFAEEPKSVALGQAVDTALKAAQIDCVTSKDPELKFGHIDIAIGLR